MPEPTIPDLQRLAAMRRSYTLGGLEEGDLAPTWLAMLERWMQDAEACGVVEPNAMVLATAGADGRPNARPSPQSQVVGSRADLEEARDALLARYPEEDAVPRPEHWGGYRLTPDVVEFWQGRPDRLHDRLAYRQTAAEDWVVERLAP